MYKTLCLTFLIGLNIRGIKLRAYRKVFRNIHYKILTMSKKKLNLEELKVQSFITSLEGKMAHTIRGGEGDLDPTNEEGSECCAGGGTGGGCGGTAAGCGGSGGAGCGGTQNGCTDFGCDTNDGCGSGATDDGGDGCGTENGESGCAVTYGNTFCG